MNATKTNSYVCIAPNGSHITSNGTLIKQTEPEIITTILIIGPYQVYLSRTIPPPPKKLYLYTKFVLTQAFTILLK